MARLSRSLLRDEFGITDEPTLAAWSEAEWFPGERPRSASSGVVLVRELVATAVRPGDFLRTGDSREDVRRKVAQARSRFPRFG